MRKISLQNLFIFVFLASLTVFTVIKLHRIDNRLSEMSKGGKRFAPSHIISEFNHNPDWDVKTPDELYAFVNVITQQPFHWLSKGYQAYAFESQDGEYVIKFFQQQRLRDRPFVKHPFSFCFSRSFHQKTESMKNNREEIFSSSKLVFEEIPNEAGFLFVHLNKTNNLLRGIRICDAAGQSFKVLPDEVSFIIQKKAQYVLPTLTTLMNQGKVEEAKVRIDQIFALLLTLAKKGIVDTDHALIRNNNIGFVKDRAIYIDTGHISKHTDLDVCKQMDYEFRKRLQPLHDWLSIKFPELATYYNMRREAILTSLHTEKSITNIAQTTPK
ncbi:MAG: hypothetical protein JWO53_1163 [Chlamydiia bacterium]|nr:hypothetical protein [Chlamydiia bacterium]